jgi:hypothetical protein
MTNQMEHFLNKFIEEKEIDLSEFVVCGDGSNIQVGDVFSAILSSTQNEQRKIKHIFVTIDFKNGDHMHFVKHLAKALTQKDKLGL